VSKRRAERDGSVYTRKDERVAGEWEDANGRTRYTTSTKTRLCHAVRSITLEVYAHMLPDHMGTAALAMNELLEEATKPALDAL
jgi:hypothetical protein